MRRFAKLTIVSALLVAGMSGAAQNNDAAQNVTVTCKMISDSETTLPFSVVLIPRSTNLTSAELYYGANPDLTFRSVEPGYYDIVGEFSVPSAIILKENIHVQQDTTIEINACEANAFDIKAYNPDGIKFELNEYEYIDGERVCVKEGNIDSCFACGGLLRKTDMNLIRPINGEYRGEIPYINDFGEDYIFVYVLVYCDKTNGEFYITKFFKDGDGSICLENNINDYVYSENEFQSSCIGTDSSDKGNGMSVYLTYNGKYINNNDCLNTNKNDKVKIWSCVPFEPETLAGGFDVLFKPGLVDYRDPTTTALYSIWGPSTAIKDGELHYICNNDRALDFLADANDSYSRSIYPGSPTFSFAENEIGGVFGNNVPINMFIERSIFDFMGEIIPQFACYYMGRFGEWREVDLPQLEVTLKVNGETIDYCTTYSSLNNNYFAPWNFFREKGITEFTFDNKNVEVDGLQGRNFTRVIIDETKEDHCAPTLTMLQMRDGNGTVTDRFEAAQDGKVTFSCGDFNTLPEIITVNLGGMSSLFLKDSYDCERPEVELNVSPNGLDQWQALDFSEDVDAYMPIGFGHVFNADITGLNNEGWYDLKFKLTDASGNMQEQVISPAFRIGSGNPSKIEVVESGTVTEVARYTVDGRIITTPQNGVNIVKMSDGTVKKVFVK